MFLDKNSFQPACKTRMFRLKEFTFRYLPGLLCSVLVSKCLSSTNSSSYKQLNLILGINYFGEFPGASELLAVDYDEEDGMVS